MNSSECPAYPGCLEAPVADPFPKCDTMRVHPGGIMRLVLTLAMCAFALSAQTKKILFSGNPAHFKQLEGAGPASVRLVSVTKETVMKEIADADAFIGSIGPEQVRAGKNLKWVQIMSAGAEGVLHRSGSNDLRDSNI